MKPVECVGRYPGRYLAAIYWLVTDREERLPTGELSTRLGVSPASTTEMTKKLNAAGFVDYEKYRGVELTPRGRTVATELARRQCIVRTFFASELETELDAETSYRIGYSLPTTGIRRLRELADQPPNGCCHETTGRRETCLREA